MERPSPHPARRRAVRQFAAAGALFAALGVAFAGAASAHVVITPGEAAPGGFATVAFQVPNESDTASTVKVEVQFPTDHPLAFVSVEPVPGWTADVQKATLDTPFESHGTEITEAVSTITWTGGSIEPGQFQRFPISVGLFPRTSTRSSSRPCRPTPTARSAAGSIRRTPTAASPTSRRPR